MSTPNPNNSPSELSFLPEDYLERKARRRANLLCGALSVLVMGTVGAAFAISERSMHGLDARLAEVDQQYGEATIKIAQVQKLHAAQKQIVQHAELAETLVEKVPRSNVLAELTNGLPPGTSLLEFSLESVQRSAPPPPQGANQGAGAADPKKAAPPGVDVKIRITGVADNDVQVALFISKLNRSNLFKDVNLLISDTFQQDKQALRRFQIEMVLNPEAEIRDTPPPSRAPKEDDSSASADEK
jgi:Tfp pilus assembly protein PilN